ncbi:MAG: Nucleoside-triphosphatase rdgB [Massilibacillus sp.]|jgi:XTP/dITP diphosphohydrolase|nr:Nucleoside-triphosphatase rdgB [Massilibacillus sp.]
MKELVIASKNKGKIKEIQAAFQNIGVKVISLSEFEEIPDAVEDGKTFEENALIKAHFYSNLTGKACLADDSGLEVDALNGEPGVYSARYAGEDATDANNNSKLIKELQKVKAIGSKARFRCVLAFVDMNGENILCNGSCEGIILEKERGNGGFGYDPLFYIEELKKSMAEITVEEKNQISHRGAALRVMAEKLAEYLK